MPQGVPKDGSRNPGWANIKVGWGHIPKPGAGPASGIPAGGPGLHGAATGNGLRPGFDSDAQPPAEHKRAGRLEAKEYREELKQRRAKVLAVYDRALELAAVATAETAAVLMAGVRVGNTIDDRLDGAAKQTIDVTQKDERTAEQIERDVKAKMALAGLLDGPGNASNH